MGKDNEMGPAVRIGPVVGIGLFGGTGPVVSLTNILCSFIVMIPLSLRKSFALAPYTLQFVYM